MNSTILLVDDSPTVRTIVKIYLAGSAFDYLEAGNGLEALEALEKNQVALVIADINMPGMDGLTFLEKLRQSDRTSHRTLPVILLTGEKSPESRARGIQAGADVLVHKPVNPADLRTAIERILPPPS